MTSPPLDSAHDRTTSGATCHHRLWKAHTAERRRVWHAIIAYGQHKWSNDIGREMPSPPLESTHGRMTSGVACHHHLWAAQTVERRRAWHAYITFGRHTVERRQAWHACIAFGQHTRSKDVERGMTSPPLDNAHGRTTSGATCHHRLWKAHTVERSRAWHAIITFGQHTRLNYVGLGMPSSP